MKKILVLFCLFFLISTVFSLSVTRSFSSPVNADNNLTVTLTIVVDQAAGTAYGIEETFPSNFTLTSSETALIYQNTLKWVDYNALQGTYTFTYKIKAPLTAGTYSISGVSQFEGQSSTTISGNTAVTVIAACIESDWTHTDGTCQPNNTLTRTWTKSGTCTGGITHTSPESVSCNYSAPTCETFTYSDWAPTVCPQSQIQTKTILTRTPTDCQGGNQEALTRSCTYVPTCTDSYWDFNLTPSTCPSYGQQTKKYFKITNCEGGVTKTDENISCTYNSPTCQYNYSTYGECITGIQTRSATATNQPCQGPPTQLTKTCTTTPTCTESNWSFSLGTCVNEIQLKDWTKTSDCNNGIQHLDENISCTQEQTEYCGSDDWDSRIEPTTCPSTGKQTKYWTRTNSNCQAGLIHSAQVIINCTPPNNNPVLECTKNEDCTSTKKCEANTCVQLKCRTGEVIENHACVFHDRIIDLTKYTSQKNVDLITKSNDPEIIELISQATSSIIANQETKATAQLNLAVLKTKINDNPANEELQTAFENAKLAINEQDYAKANTLIIDALENNSPKEENPLTQFAPILVFLVIAIIILFLFRKKPEPEIKINDKKKLMNELKNNAKKIN